MLWGKTAEIYESRRRADWQRSRAALKAAGIPCRAGHTQLEPGVCGCGARIDIRESTGNFDPETYYIYVRPEDEGRAKALLASDGDE